MAMGDHIDLKDKRVLVTGGTTGIGRATVKMLAGMGAHVLTFGRHREYLDEAISEAGEGGRVEGVVADVSEREGIDRIFAAVDDRLGGIDMLVSCAALGAKPVHEMDEDDWRYVVETNLVGSIACTRAAVLRMDAQGGGRVLLVSSISPEIKAVGESVYAATKAGINAFAETLRKEIADRNITITVIQPGSVSTPMQECSDEEKAQAIADHEMLYADDIAETIVFALTRPERVDIVNLRIEPRVQKTS